MKKNYRILIATDFSDSASNAALYAFKFAFDIKASIMLLHVYESPIGVLPVDHLAIEGKKDAFLETEYELLAMHKNKIYNETGLQEDELRCIYSVREGSASEQILLEAKEWGADFVVMGTHGASGIKNIVFGTHTWQVIKNANVPVLAIPANVVYKPVKQIAFAAGEREGEIPALKFLASLAIDFDAFVSVLHVTDYAISKGYETELFSRFQTEIKTKINSDKVTLKIEYSEDVLLGLLEYCKRNEMQWLVMTHEKTSLLSNIILPIQSLTKKMSAETTLPLLCVPDFFNPSFQEFWRLFESNEKLLNEIF